MSSYPTNIRSTPENIVVFIIKYIFKSIGCVHHISCCGMHHSLRFSRTGSIEYKQRIFSIISAVLLSEACLRLQPLVTSFLHVDGAVRSFTTNTLATQGVLMPRQLFLLNQSFCSRDIHHLKWWPFYNHCHLFSTTADAENPAKQRSVWLQFWHMPKW
jgi:hypothetical protein